MDAPMHFVSDVCRAGLAMLPLAGALLCVAFPAAADVLALDTNGAPTIYAGPGVYRDGSFTPLSLPSAARGAVPVAIQPTLALAAGRYSVDADLLARVAWTESRNNQAAISPKGAVGVMQLMDDTARGLGVNRYDLAQNIQGGAAYLRQMLDRYRGDTRLALAAYNAGPGAVDHYGGVPPFPETLAFVASVLGEARP